MSIQDILLKKMGSSSQYKLFDYKKTKNIVGVKGASDALLLAKVFEDNKKTIIVITENEEEAYLLFQSLSFYNEHSFYYPNLDIVPFTDMSPSRDILSERINILYRAVVEKPSIITMSIKSLSKILPSKNIFKSYFKYINVGDRLSIDELRLYLSDLGYIIENEVSDIGTIALRSSIIDIYSPSYESPIRIELFDDEVENIRLFDLDTGRSHTKMDSVVIIPVLEMIYTDDMVSSLIEKKILPPELEERLLLRKFFAGSENLMPLFYDSLDNSIFFDYFNEPIIFTINNGSLFSTANEYIESIEAKFEEEHNYKVLGSYNKLYFDVDYIKQKITDTINIAPFPTANEDEIVFDFKQGKSFKAKMAEFIEYINENVAAGYKVILSTGSEEQASRFEKITEALKPKVVFNDEDAKAINYNDNFIIIVSHINSGFVSDELKMLFIADYEVFGRKRKEHKRIPKQNKSLIETFIDLNENDYVVHINYGIGIYRGLSRRTVGGKEKDYLTIEYAGGDKLFITVEQMNFVQKYLSAGSSRAPALSKLGGGAWDKVRAKAKSDAEAMARDLIRLYTVRSNMQGYAYGEDTEWQDDFEASFPYEETIDQLRTVSEIKTDMQSSKMMDRLVCGDVGFGKTEVAFRAAFKAVMSGKQVAILCPTTILSQQHYKSARQRFKDFPVNIGLLNRFRTNLQIKDTEAAITSGDIDIVIGTHKIISKNVIFKNLGLIIIDEEHRFGVKHKEALKRFRLEVDVLTLSATPIPRTLNMALSTIRDISIIETPPLNRQPVKTFVMEFSEAAMEKAIEAELARDGQVFFLHNRVETIDRFATMVQSRCPNARIATAHGQMNGNQLENIMNGFINHEYDILISTTIIENGIDIPNANTILIERADMLGLSELYQLRGRVGRSSREAYAYLFYPADKSMTQDAYKRLEAIAEHTDLGSGFKIAMRDLEIRGAGNIVGKEQSGAIHQVGFELYTQLLEEASSQYRGEIKETTFDTAIDLKHDLFIPDEYIDDSKEKISVYKLIMRAQDDDDIKYSEEFLIDKYGALPDNVKKIITIATLKVFLKKHRIISVIEGNYNIYIKLNEYSHFDIKKLSALVSRSGSGVYIDTNDLNRIAIPITTNTLEWKVQKVIDTVSEIADFSFKNESKPSEDKSAQILDTLKKQEKNTGVGSTVSRKVRKRAKKIIRMTERK